MSLPQIDDYHRLFLDDIELLDVRAPVEYQQGAFPLTRNVPLLDDDERHQVGLCYKTRGQDKAIELGYELVSGDVKSARLEAWEAFFRNRPHAALYCFRGGMRSKITQQWLYEKTGIKYPRIKGGYRALRRFLLQQLEVTSDQLSFYLLSGRTGVGKTLLLHRIEQKIDLEGIFHHRGSVFGTHVSPQPSQIDIENVLSIQLLKFQHRGISTLLLEDESANIGARRIPETVFNQMRSAPILLLDADPEERVDIIFDEYITQSLDEHNAFWAAGGNDNQGFEKWSEYLLTALDKIQRRLGGKAHQALKKIMQDALHQQQINGETVYHRDWIARLLFEYYDPMYDYQLSKKSHRIVFSGNKTEMLKYLEEKKFDLADF